MTAEYLIRKAKIDDLNGVMDAHRESIQKLCSKDYNDEQIKKWSDVNYSEEIWKNSVNEEHHLVIEYNGKIEGFCHSKVHQNGDGEILGLYFTPVVSGRGIGREVFQKAMEYIKEMKSTRVFIYSTKTAKGFYEKMGFKPAEEKKIKVRGIEIECFKMVRNL